MIILDYTTCFVAFKIPYMNKYLLVAVSLFFEISKFQK